MIIKSSSKYIVVIIVILLQSCLNKEEKENIERLLNSGIVSAQKLVADQNFKTTINLIEVYKLRFGDYPENLNAIKYIGYQDSSAYKSLEYIRLENGYTLNLKMDLINVKGDTVKEGISINYPEEFWQGLGVVKSNLKK